MNFLETLDLRQIEHKPGSSPAEINICCPFCLDQGQITPDSRFRLGINLKKGFAHCFNCEWGSKKDTFKKILDKLNIVEELTPVEVKKEKEEEHELEWPDAFERLWPKKKDKDFLKAYKYVRNRGITRHQIKKYKIGFCLSGPLAYRVVFPVVYNHELCGLVGRDLTGKSKAKYKNSVGKKILYGARKPPKRADVAALVEGPIDKLAGERAVKEIDFLGILGKAITDRQMRFLQGYKKVIIIPDNDVPGFMGAMKLREKLALVGHDVWVAFVDGKKDLGESSDKAIRKLIKRAKPFDDTVRKRMKLKIAFGDLS